MNPEGRKLAVVQAVSPWHFDRPGILPSQALRNDEARLVAQLAMNAHAAGRKFVGWPKIEMSVADSMRLSYGELRVSVDTVPL